MNKPLILVVEDDPPVRNLITTTLKTNDYRYLSAANGETAIMEASSHNPDIVLLDLGLPDVDGVQVIENIRSWSNLPIIVISARSEDTDKIEALDAGADDYLTKPFSVEELLARLRVTQRRLTFMSAEALAAGSVFVNGKLRVDYAGGCAFLDGQELHLTLISQSICLVFMICYLKKKRLFNMRLNLFDKAFILPLIQKAVPAIVQQSIPAISTTFLTALISSYSITAIAAYGITGKLETILFYPAMALNMVLTTIIGQCVGGKRTDRVKDYLKCALKYGSLFLFLLSAIIVSSSKYLSMLFVRSSDVASIVSGYFLIVGIGYILNTITNCFLGMLNGLGQPSKSMLLMIFYYIIVRMPLAYLFSYLGLGLNGIWIAVLISHICAAIAAMLFSMLQLKRKTTIS